MREEGKEKRKKNSKLAQKKKKKKKVSKNSPECLDSLSHLYDRPPGVWRMRSKSRNILWVIRIEFHNTAAPRRANSTKCFGVWYIGANRQKSSYLAFEGPACMF